MQKKKDWEKKKGKGLWQEYVNKNTGESSIKHHDLTQKVTTYDCEDHYWDLIDSKGNIKCRVCGLGQRIVWGKHFVKEGKVINAKNV